MKKFGLYISFISFFALNGLSQVNPHAIGIRGGIGIFGRGGEISYQHGLGESNRLEIDLGWRGNNGNNWNNGHGNHFYDGRYYSQLFITGIYHWNWNIVDGLNWFIGPGAQIGFYDDKWDDQYDGISIGIGGQIGIEYDFSGLGAPLLLGLDSRPMWSFISGPRYGYGASLSLRYVF